MHDVTLLVQHLVALVRCMGMNEPMQATHYLHIKTKGIYETTPTEINSDRTLALLDGLYGLYESVTNSKYYEIVESISYAHSQGHTSGESLGVEFAITASPNSPL